MSELISWKEALIALANGEDVEYWTEDDPRIQMRWTSIKSMAEYRLSYFLDEKTGFKFRLKPLTIKLNGIEVIAPFKPKQSEWGDIGIYYLDPSQSDGWNIDDWNENFDMDLMQFGAWKTEEEIKQVVAALRSVFNEKTKEGDTP